MMATLTTLTKMATKATLTKMAMMATLTKMAMMATLTKMAMMATLTYQRVASPWRGRTVKQEIRPRCLGIGQAPGDDCEDYEVLAQQQHRNLSDI